MNRRNGSIDDILTKFCKRLVACDMDIFGLRKSAQPAQDEAKWITVHPGGKGPKKDGSGEKGGTSVLIDDETGRIMGGMGGKFKGEKINEIKKSFVGPKTPKNLQKGAPDNPDDIDMDEINKLPKNTKAPTTKLQNQFEKEAPFALVDAVDKLWNEGKYKEANNIVNGYYFLKDKKSAIAYAKRQNAYKEAWLHLTPEKISERKQRAQSSMRPQQLASVPVGKEMTHEEADTGKVNPDFAKGGGYNENCQTCAVAYEARRRGYNVKAKPYSSKIQETLAGNQLSAWIDPATGGVPKILYPETLNLDSQKYYNYLNTTIKQGERYFISHAWKKRGDGHIVTVSKNTNNEIEIYDPQGDKTYTGFKACKAYFNNVQFAKKQYQWTFPTPPQLIRVDNMAFDTSVVDSILERE